MGFGGIGPGSIILILVIVILIFGTKKLRNVGSDLGGAIRNFKSSMKEGEQDVASQQIEKKEGDAIDAEVVEKKEESS